MPTMIAPPPTVRPLNVAETRQGIAEVRHLITSGQLKAAAIQIWTVFESAIRLSLTELGQQTDDSIWISDSPYGLSSQAVAYGVIDPEDRDVLLRFLSRRDAAAHGDVEAIDAGLLQEVSRFTERTLDELEQQHNSEAVLGDYQMPVTVYDVIAFINAHPGRTFYTTGTPEKPFTVAVDDVKFVYTLSSGNTYQQPRSDMEQLLQKFAELHSLKPSDYHHPQRPGSRFSSYFVGLMAALENGRSAEKN